MQEMRRCKIFCKQDYGDTPCMQTLEIIVEDVIYFKELGIHPKGMKFHWYHRLHSRNLINGILTL